MVAEDNPVNQKVMRAMLERLGHKPDIVENGLEAVRAFDYNEYDIVLMDVQMPEMDGFEATKILRDRFPLGTLRIVAVTANAMPEDQRRCLDAGMDDYVAKPVTVAKLMAALEIHPGSHSENDVSQSLDFEVLSDLTMAIGEERTADILDTYIVNSASIIAEITIAFAAGSSEQIAALAHRLKGSSGVVGANKLASLCALLDSQARRSFDEIDIGPVNMEFENVQKAMSEYRARF